MSLVLPSIGMASVAYPRESGGGEIKRNNEIGQSIDSNQEACTNEASVDAKSKGDLTISMTQSNDCLVEQGRSTSNFAALGDNPLNEID